MSHRTALVIAVVLVALILGDMLFKDGQTLVFLGRKFLHLLEWVKVWR